MKTNSGEPRHIKDTTSTNQTSVHQYNTQNLGTLKSLAYIFPAMLLQPRRSLEFPRTTWTISSILSETPCANMRQLHSRTRTKIGQDRSRVRMRAPKPGGMIRCCASISATPCPWPNGPHEHLQRGTQIDATNSCATLAPF